MAEAKKFPYDDQFPQNVNPTEENRREFSERMERERQEREDESRKLTQEEDASKPDVVAATRTVPLDEPEPEANERPAKKRQGQSVN